jgi:hypothetical protein
MSFNAKVDCSGAEVDLGRVLDARVSRIGHAPSSRMIHFLHSHGRAGTGKPRKSNLAGAELDFCEALQQ